MCSKHCSVLEDGGSCITMLLVERGVLTLHFGNALLALQISNHSVERLRSVNKFRGGTHLGRGGIGAGSTTTSGTGSGRNALGQPAD